MIRTLPAIGGIGLGNAGLALATPLMRVFDVAGYDRNALQRDKAQAAGVRVAATAAELAAKCDTVLLSLPTPAASLAAAGELAQGGLAGRLIIERSEEHTSELQSLMRISYAVFCLKKKNKK